MIPLACTVRGCGQPLTRRERVWICPRGHNYDSARSGYVNLLQPQDRKSGSAGDSRASVEARARLLSRGIGRALVDHVVALAVAFRAAPVPVVVDLGCGAGDVLGALATRRSIDGIGIDLSAAAADLSARRFPEVTWVVANVDRRLPLRDSSVDLIFSIHGRRHPAECARVLKPEGLLIAAVPAADDLVELREHVGGGRVERDRTAGFLEEHGPLFTLRERAVVRRRARFDLDELHDMLRGTYRGGRHSAVERVASLGPMNVTLASEVLELTPNRPRRMVSRSK